MSPVYAVVVPGRYTVIAELEPPLPTNEDHNVLAAARIWPVGSFIPF